MSTLRHILIILFVVVTGCFDAAGENVRNVKVIDSETGQPISHAVVFLKGEGSGISTDKNGVATLHIKPGEKYIKVIMTGYAPVEAELETDITEIHLTPRSIELDEVEVKRHKARYSKRNNPAVDLMGKVREAAKASDPDRQPFYNFDVYEKITLAINRFGQGNRKPGQFSFLHEYVDTSEISSLPILNISVKEKLSKRHYRKEPFARKERIEAIRRIGLDDFIDQSAMQTLLNDVLREIDIYNNDIVILQNRFVGPFSSIGADFYKYYITDTVMVNGYQCVELSFVPRTSESFGFTGRAYISIGDSSFLVKKAQLSVPRAINLNFVDQLSISQDFKLSAEGLRHKETDNMTVELTIIPGTQGLHIDRTTVYSNHDTLPASNPDIYNYRGSRIVTPLASMRGESFWDSQRPLPLKESELRIGEMAQRLRSNSTYYWAEKTMRILASGYIPTAAVDSASKFDIGPWNTFISGNDIEGTRLRLGGMTTCALNPRWFARGYAAYGTKDHRWKYSAELEYSFTDKQRHSREFPVHSIMLSHKYDVDMIGQHYAFTNADNFVLSWTRMKNRLMTYQRTSMLKYTLELENNFSVEASISSVRQDAGLFLPFEDSHGNHFGHYNENTVKLRLRYAPGETFFQTRSHRIPINSDAPVFSLEQTYGPKGFAGNKFEFNKTEFSVSKRIWFSAFGYLDATIKGGHLWSSVPYPALLIPDANISYTIQPESFSLMNPMEFMSDSYAEWHLSYWANGAILNYIPLIKRLKLREVFSFRGYIGDLSDRNKPSGTNSLFLFPEIARATPMHGRPYMEASVGLDNILRIFRVDYVWRINYRNVTGTDRRGVRIALHFTF